MTTQAVLFDFDGVLADTENVHVAAWERTFDAMGWDLTAEECARAAEIDDRVFLAEVFSKANTMGDVLGWANRKQAITRALLADVPPLQPGVRDLIERLKGRARLAVVSGTWRENVETVLRSAGLRDAFELIVAKEDTQAPKPHPEAYRLALKKLGLPAWEARAIEDSHAGWASARAAGLVCLVVGSRDFPTEPGREVPDRLPDLRDTYRVLNALGPLAS